MSTRSPPPLPPSPSSAHPDAAAAAAAAASDVRKVRKVRFNPYVHKLMLPLEEWEDAQAARQSQIKEAPYNDELWDGDEGDFRPTELTPDELWTMRLREKVGVLPHKWTHPLKSGMKALFHSLTGPKTKDIDAVYSHAKKSEVQVVGETAAELVALAKEKPIRKIGLKRQSSSMSRKPSEMVLSEFTGAKPSKIFARFDSLQEQIHKLKLVPEELLQQERVLVAQLLELNNVKAELQTLRMDIPDLERKIERQASASIFMSMYASEKPKQLQQDLRRMRNEQKLALSRLSQLGGEIFTTNKKIERLGESLVSLRACEAELFDIETFVVNRHLKFPDEAMEHAMLAIDELKRQLEREEQTKTRLRQACETTLPQQVCQDLDQAQASLLLANELLGTIFAKHQANPNSPMYVTPREADAAARPVNLAMDDVMFLTVRRREALNRMRESAVHAMQVLNSVLDDLEESCGHDNWSESVLKWRLEVPNMLAPELFGIATKKSPLQEEINAEALNKFKERSGKRLGAISTCKELATRYVGFFQREILRTKNRLDRLAVQKEALKEDLLARRKEVFENARRMSEFGGVGEDGEDGGTGRSQSFDESVRPPSASMDYTSSSSSGGGGRDRVVSMDFTAYRSGGGGDD
ncbi:hypothetical protein BASA81_005328 [Batrachochytrium salamandrivorans]|nr:hypothetical protein BASA81_005328 [Batrachochytrium salamandrivorans]